MSKIYCRIEQGFVVDRAIFDGEMPADWPGRNTWYQHDDAQIGWFFEGGQLVPPPVPEVPVFGPRLPNLEPDQFWFVVRLTGHEQELRDWVTSLNDPGSPNYDPVAWAWASAKLDKAKYFERDHPLVEAAREALGMSEAELDALWSYATQ